MSDMLHYACFLWLLTGLSIFTSLFNNSAASACVFIPSGGRVGAARLNRHMTLNRV